MPGVFFALKKNYTYILPVFLLLAHSVAHSQLIDTSAYSTDEINVVSSRISTNVFLSPVRVDILNSANIGKVNGSYLSDILRNFGGVFVKSYGGNSLSTISANGLGAEHTLILLNGFKLNSEQNNLVDLNQISKDNIERIEIMNNGSSSIYGSEAIGGVINVITKQSNLQKLDLDINATAGSFAHKKFSGSIGSHIGKLDARLNFSRDVSDNNYNYFFNDGMNMILKQRENAGYEYSEFGVNAKYELNRKLLLRLFSSYTDRYVNLPGIEAGSSPSNANQRDRFWNSIASIEKIVFRNSSLKSEFNFQNSISNYHDNSLSSHYKNITLSNSSRYDYSGKLFSVTSGFDLNYFSLQSNETEGGIKRFQPGLYGSFRIPLSKSVNIFPNLRYDYFSDINKNVVSGKLGLNIKPFENYNLNLKASAGNNFASPTFNELYWNNIGNKNLDPEYSFNADIGAIAGFNLFSENTFEISYTYINATDKIVWTPKGNGIWQPENIGKSESNSAAVSLKSSKTFSNVLEAGLNFYYTFTSSLKKNKNSDNDPTYDKQMFYVPEHVFKFGLMVGYRNFGTNLFYSYIGKRYTDLENRNYLPPSGTVDGNMTQKIELGKFNLKLGIEVNNILNENYQVISGYPMPLRSFNINIGVEH